MFLLSKSVNSAQQQTPHLGAKLLSAHTKSVILFDDYIISYDGMIIIILDFDFDISLFIIIISEHPRIRAAPSNNSWPKGRHS